MMIVNTVFLCEEDIFQLFFHTLIKNRDGKLSDIGEIVYWTETLCVFSFFFPLVNSKSVVQSWLFEFVFVWILMYVAVVCKPKCI